MAEKLGEALLVLETDDRTAPGVARAKGRAEELARHFDRIGRRMAKIGGVMTAAVGAAVGGITLAIRGVLNDADDMAKAAQKFAVPIDELSRLKHAADLSGVSFEALGVGLRMLAKNMNDAANGTGEAKDAFRQLGISVTGADGRLKSSSAVLNEVAEKLAAMPDGALKTALAMRIFGRSGADLIPMLNAGAAGIQKMKDEADALGIVFDQNTGRAAEAFNDNLTRLGRAFDGIKTVIAAELAPVLADLSDWFAQQGPAIVQHVRDIVGWFRELSPEAQKLIGIVAGLTVVAGPLIAGLGLMAIAIGAISAPVLAVIAGVAALTAGLVFFRDETAMVLSAIPGFGPVLSALVQHWDKVTEGIMRAISALRAFFSASAESKLADVRSAIELQRENLRAQQERVFAPGLSTGQRRRAEDRMSGFLEKLGELRARERALQAEVEKAGKPAEIPAVTLPAPSLPAAGLPAIPAGGGGGGGGKGKAAPDDPWADALKSARAMIDAVRQQTREIGLNEAQVARLRLETDLTAAAQEKFGTVTDETRAQIAALGEQIEVDALVKMARLEEEAEKSAEGIGDAFRDMGSEILDPLKRSLIDGTLSFRSFADAIVGIGQNMATRLLDAAFRPIEEAISGLFSGGGSGGGLLGSLGNLFRNIIGGSVAPATSPIPIPRPVLPGFAGGGWAERWAMVGERGPEPVYLGQGGRVFSNEDFRSAVGGGGTVVNVYTPPGSEVREERSRSGGMEQVNLFIEQAVARGISTPGSAIQRALSTGFGARPVTTKR